MKANHTLFIRILNDFARLRLSLNDPFYGNLLDSKAVSLAEGYLLWKSLKEEELKHKNISHPFNQSLGGALEFVTQLKHLGNIEETPLLNLQQALLEMKLEAIILIKNVKKVSQKPTESLPEAEESPIPVKIRPAKSLKPTPSLNRNQESILSFIKETHSVRTKQVIDQFSTLSGRTVKRNLKELLTEGLIVKQADNHGGMYYSAA